MEPIANPEPTQTLVVDKKSFPWWLLVVALAGWLLSGFFGYSLKQTRDKLTAAASSHSVTITEPVEVGGKIVYKTTTVHDTQTVTIHDKETTIWKSGVSLGVAIDLATGDRGGTIQADVIPLGPGTVQVSGLITPQHQYGGVAYRFLF